MTDLPLPPHGPETILCPVCEHGIVWHEDYGHCYGERDNCECKWTANDIAASLHARLRAVHDALIMLRRTESLSYVTAARLLSAAGYPDA